MKKPETTSAPSEGTCHVQLFPKAALPTKTTLRERLHLAIHGGRVSNRVSANAVGRQGRSPEGRSPSRFLKCRPSGKGPSGSDRQSFEFTSVSMRSRRPGLENRVRDRYGDRGGVRGGWRRRGHDHREVQRLGARWPFLTQSLSVPLSISPTLSRRDLDRLDCGSQISTVRTLRHEV